MNAARAYAALGRIGEPAGDFISEVDAAKIRSALMAGRAGTASLTILAEAYDIAAKHGMEASQNELLAHIRARLPKQKLDLSRSEDRKAALRNLGVGIGLGVLCGIGTHFVLVAIGERQRGQ